MHAGDGDKIIALSWGRGSEQLPVGTTTVRTHNQTEAHTDYDLRVPRRRLFVLQ